MRTLGIRKLNVLTKLAMWGYGLILHRRSVWNAGICRPYREALALGLIEPRIAGLVATLNVEGVIETSACCEGHLYDDGKVEYPYIGFRRGADIALLSLMNRALVDASPTAAGTLNYHWIVEYGWVFAMRPHLPDEIFDRAKVDDDFTALSKVLRDAIAQYTSRIGQAL